MRATNYIKLLIPCSDQTMYAEKTWFVNRYNIRESIAEAQYALADAQRQYSGTSWKARPRLVAWQPLPDFPQIEDFVGVSR